LIANCISTAAAGTTTPAASSTATRTYARSSTVRACTVVADCRGRPIKRELKRGRGTRRDENGA
jgi:hypothetical protein